MAEEGEARRLPTNLDVLASDVHSKVEFYKTAYMDCVGINNALHSVIEEKGKLQQEQNAVLQLAAEKDQLIAELNAQKDHLATRNEKQAAEIESLKEQLKDRQSSHALLALQGSGLQSNQSGIKGHLQAAEIESPKQQLKERQPSHALLALQGSGLQTNQSGIVYIRTKRPRQSNGNGEDVDNQGLITELEDAKKELSAIQSKLIKGFIEFSGTAARNIAVKNIGQLSDKPFLQACLKKLSPKEAQEKACELYNFWQKQLLNPEWNPTKTPSDDADLKEVDVHDVELQELRGAWGEEVYKAVVNCLIEIQECGRPTDRTIFPELWNYKENRKATRSECVEYLFYQVKRLGRSSRRAVSGKNDSDEVEKLILLELKTGVSDFARN